MSSTSTAPVASAAPASDLLRRWIQPLQKAGLSHWLPIFPLSERHRPMMERHLLALSDRDRYLRFGYPATDERIRQHVAQLDFDRHELFGIFDRHLELLATAHLAYVDDDHRSCEFAVSVVPRARGRGFGKRLFAHAVRHCQNRRVDQLFIHALTENTAMLRIARGAGATVRPEGSEAEAWLQLPPDSLGSHMTELVDSRAAGLNYLVKRQGQHLRRVASLLAEVKSRFASVRGIAGH
jgi:RimJ/RimL family protein N-acetyltransferase